MQATDALQEKLDVSAQAFYGNVLDTFLRAEIPFLVGGAYAFAWIVKRRRMATKLTTS